MPHEQRRFFVCVPEGYFEMSEDEKKAAAQAAVVAMFYTSCDPSPRRR